MAKHGSYRFVKKLIQDESVDKSLYVTGLSMGGMGNILKLFIAILNSCCRLPICGGGDVAKYDKRITKTHFGFFMERPMPLWTSSFRKKWLPNSKLESRSKIFWISGVKRTTVGTTPLPNPNTWSGCSRRKRDLLKQLAKETFLLRIVYFINSRAKVELESIALNNQKVSAPAFKASRFTSLALLVWYK